MMTCVADVCLLFFWLCVSFFECEGRLFLMACVFDVRMYGTVISMRDGFLRFFNFYEKKSFLFNFVKK